MQTPSYLTPEFVDELRLPVNPLTRHMQAKRILRDQVYLGEHIEREGNSLSAMIGNNLRVTMTVPSYSPFVGRNTLRRTAEAVQTLEFQIKFHRDSE